jgi:hypothetical protein
MMIKQSKSDKVNLKFKFLFKKYYYSSLFSRINEWQLKKIHGFQNQID